MQERMRKVKLNYLSLTYDLTQIVYWTKTRASNKKQFMSARIKQTQYAEFDLRLTNFIVQLKKASKTTCAKSNSL